MKRWLIALPALLSGALASAGGCSLAVDSSDLDAHCPPTQKYCDNRCVDKTDPHYGCRPASCEPCAETNATSICQDEACAPGVCLKGFGCDNCMTNIFEREHCGGCGKDFVCRENELCMAGECKPR